MSENKWSYAVSSGTSFSRPLIANVLLHLNQRTLQAAEELEKLAAEVEQLDGSDIHQRILKLFDLAEPYYATIGEDLNEGVSAELRSVGFHGGYTGAELLEWYHKTLERAVRDAINNDSGGVDGAELEEQVADDPAVKAAKRAYDDAYAKAYAEARKRL